MEMLGNFKYSKDVMLTIRKYRTNYQLKQFFEECEEGWEIHLVNNYYTF